MSNAAKIMVVDDSPAIVDSIEMMLDFEGFEVAKFYKGSEMFNALDPNSKPDVILMDMWLSGEDGRDFCKLIKAHENFHDIPVLIMSASRGLGQSALDAGADEFIAKPFDLGNMVERIRHYLK
ncbi:response regulator transcription factor [Chryseobacterium profundimaris]|uniref:Response regulator receiver domain-containing protein n=1 Tax=Chryseobacterium profundimaris TaxID=1387275 RepID=A0ABY1PBY4_9FLAO|nr:response regulator [Chryseobacterium profundimaris]SMP28886.1 Response regulator receiver domain-containing protein [Chryseobacterium profundimaris]